MQLVVILAAVIAIAAASVVHPPRPNHRWEEENRPEYGIESNKFEAGKEYQYMYNGQLMTGIPQSSEQHSATRIQAVVSIVFREHNKLAMQLRHVRFASLHDKVSEPRRLQPFGLFEPIDIVSEHLETLRLPVESKYHHGMIKDLVFDGADAPWSVNIKRGVLNMIQVNLRKERRTDLTEEMDKETIQPFDMFTTQEETIEGDCETVYSVESLPVQYRREIDEDVNVLNVTKSINFEKCQSRPEINYNFRMASPCPSCEQKYTESEKMLRASTIIKQSLLVTDKRDKCLVEKVVVESQYTFVPYTSEGNVVQTYVNMTLELIKSSDRVNSIPKIDAAQSLRGEESKLLYSLDWDVTKENFFMHGDESSFKRTTPFAPIKDTIKFMRSVIEPLISAIGDEVTEEAPRQFTRLVKIMRTLSHKEIEAVYEHYYIKSQFSKEETFKVQGLVIDAIALAGTDDAVKFIVEKTHSKGISPVRAALAFRKFTQIRTVSNTMLESVYKTVKKCGKDISVKCQSATLAYGSMVNAMCNGEQDKLAVKFVRAKPECTEARREQHIERLFNEISHRDEHIDSKVVLVLKAIGNAGQDIALPRLMEFIKKTKYSPLVRAEAVQAMRIITEQSPRKVEKVLMPVYLERTMPTVVRVAAIHQLLKTMPEKSLLDQLTRSLLVEENKQVAAFTFTAMNSLANSTNPCEKKFAEDLTLSLRHARFIENSDSLGYSKYSRVQLFSRSMNTGLNMGVKSVMSNYSRIPQMVSAGVDLTRNNMWMKDVISVGISQQNIDQGYQYVMRQLYHDVNTPIEELFDSSEETKDVNPKFAKSLEKVFEDLSIEERQFDWPESTKEGIPDTLLNFYLRMGNQDQWMLPIDYTSFTKEIRESFESESEMSLQKMIQLLSKMKKDMSLPYNMQAATFGQQLSRKIPTTLGLPLQLTLTTPIVIQLQGVAKINLNKQTPLRKINVELKAKSSITATKMIKIESWSPIVNSALKVVTTVHVNVPIDAKITVDGLKQEPQVKISFKPSQKAFDLVRVQSRPITSVLVWPVQLQQWKEANERTIHGGEWTRQTLLNKRFGQRSLGMEIVTRGYVHTTPAMKVTTTPFCEFAGPNKFSITVRPGDDMPKTYEMIISGKLFERLSKQKMGRQMENFFSESDEYLRSSEERSNDYSQKYEGANPTQHQLRLVLKTVGSAIKREAVVETSAKCGDKNMACTYKLAIRRSPVPRSEESEEWKLDSELSVLYPETPKSFEQIATGKYMCRLNAKWGKDKFVDFKLVGEQSELMEKLIERSVYRRSSLKHKQTYRSLYSPVSQHDQLVKFSVLDQYKIDADYSVSPIVRNITEKALRLAKTIYYWQTEVNTQLPKELRSKSQIRARVNIDPINRQYVNVTIQTPVERVIFKDIALPMPIKGVNIRSSESFSSLVQGGRQQTGICQLRSGRVQTFDGVKYSTPIPQCWTLLTKDCHHREQAKFAVFVKETESELKSLKIVTQHIKLIVRALPENELECELNGKKVECGDVDEVFVHGRHLALRVTKGEYLKIELPEAGLRVYFDGLSVNVKTDSSVYSSSLCGLCGQCDREERCELMTAQRECLSEHIPRDIRRFVQSYMIEECDMSENEEHYTYEPLSWEHEEKYRQIYGDEEETPVTYGYSMKEKKTISPRPKTLVMEQSGEICLSKEPVLRCPRHSRAIEHADNLKPVVYSCVNRNTVEADRLLREVRESRVVRRVSEMEASYQTTVNVPTKCIRV